jgi:hypothetical protein
MQEHTQQPIFNSLAARERDRNIKPRQDQSLHSNTTAVVTTLESPADNMSHCDSKEKRAR